MKVHRYAGTWMAVQTLRSSEALRESERQLTGGRRPVLDVERRGVGGFPPTQTMPQKTSAVGAWPPPGRAAATWCYDRIIVPARSAGIQRHGGKLKSSGCSRGQGAERHFWASLCTARDLADSIRELRIKRRRPGRNRPRRRVPPGYAAPWHRGRCPIASGEPARPGGINIDRMR